MVSNQQRAGQGQWQHTPTAGLGADACHKQSPLRLHRQIINLPSPPKTPHFSTVFFAKVPCNRRERTPSVTGTACLCRSRL